MNTITQILWRRRLISALRTVVACTIVGCTTLYGPKPLRNLLTFPAFSYVTTVLIVSDATLGNALRGCWHAFYATIQFMLPSLLILKVIGPAKFTVELAAVSVAVTVFGVALPDSTHLMTKRIAFGQTVIVYVGAVVRGVEIGAMMLPVHVASSTALGAVASVLAMLIPCPHLAFLEVRRTCRIYAENATQRLNLLMEAFSAQNNRAALDFLTEAKTLAETGNKLLRIIRDKQEGMKWENWFRKPNWLDPGKKLEEMEKLMRGMELALASSSSFPIVLIDESIRDFLQTSKVHIGVKLEQLKSSVPLTAPDTKEEETMFTHQTGITISTARQHLLAFFFLNHVKLLRNGSAIARILKGSEEDGVKSKECKGRSWLEAIWGSLLMWLSSERLVFAFKCSISLALAVLLGLMYNKKNGYWSGLTVAISFATGRQVTFTVANARAQGTAMGSIYGIICCFVFRKYVDFWFLPLLPWIVFASLLRHSRMYGQAGGISAAVGALLILGRRNYGDPTEFAIARITEAAIGLTCLIMVEVLLQPVRAATLAKIEVSRCVRALRDCIEGMVICGDEKGADSNSKRFRTIRRDQKKFALHVHKLESFIGEAESEPNFWFRPFPGSCHRKLLGSLSKMADIMAFMAVQMEIFARESSRLGVAWEELEEQIKDDLEMYVEKIGSSLKCLYKALQIKPKAKIKKQKQNRGASHDMESGKPANGDHVCTHLGLEEENAEQISYSFLQHSMGVANIISGIEGEEMIKSQMVLCLSSLGFCISSLVTETIQIEKEVTELVKWENPGRGINLHEIISNHSTTHTT